MDVQSADKETAQNINIRINAKGEAEFAIYDTGGVIHYDPNDMAICHSYAFIMIEANGQRHQIDNIGMEAPEIRALVEVMNTLMPGGINLEYGEGYMPSIGS